jgi:hypothetical protein
MDYIFQLSVFNELEMAKGVSIQFDGFKTISDNKKKALNNDLGPYLANPYYKNELIAKEHAEKERYKHFIEKLNHTQLSLIDNEEKLADEFLKKVNNNFEALVLLFDNFIFEEEFIPLGDEEYFKERKDYNELNKLKSDSKLGFNLDSKRTFRKVYQGVDRSKLRLNYYEKFHTVVVSHIQCKHTT